MDIVNLLTWIRANYRKLHVEYSESIANDMDSKVFKKTYQAKIKEDYYLNASAICGLGEHEGTCYGCEIEVITPKGTATMSDSVGNCESSDIYEYLEEQFDNQKQEIRNDFMNQLN